MWVCVHWHLSAAQLCSSFFVHRDFREKLENLNSLSVSFMMSQSEKLTQQNLTPTHFRWYIFTRTKPQTNWDYIKQLANTHQHMVMPVKYKCSVFPLLSRSSKRFSDQIIRQKMSWTTEKSYWTSVVVNSQIVIQSKHVVEISFKLCEPSAAFLNCEKSKSAHHSSWEHASEYVGV